MTVSLGPWLRQLACLSIDKVELDDGFVRMFSDKEAHMIDPITPSQFLQSEGVEDWRLTSEGATAFFRTRSFAESARFVQAISELPGVEDHHPGVDVRHDGVTVHMITYTDDYFGPSSRDVELARQISAVASKLAACRRGQTSPQARSMIN